MAEKVDVAVVGAGPAGSRTAQLLAAGGLRTVLFEKHPSVGYPVSCAEGVSKMGIENEIPVHESWIADRILGAIVRGPGGEFFKVHHPDAGYILERKIFDRDLAIAAAESGAEVHVNEGVTSMQRVGAQWELKTTHPGSYLADFVVAADGVESLTARMAGFPTHLPLGDVHTCAQYLIVSDEIEQGYPEFILGNRTVPGGYAWVFPKGPGRANVGLGLAAHRTDRPARRYLDEWLPTRFKRYRIVEFMAGAVPGSAPVDPLVRDRVLLVGDAGRLTDPFSGGGIAHALTSGRLAAEAILAAAGGTESALDEYPRRWHQFAGKRMATHLKVRKLFIKMTDDDFTLVVNFLRDTLHEKTITHIDTIEFLRKLIFGHPRILMLGRHIFL